jgi:hypothetical protein
MAFLHALLSVSVAVLVAQDQPTDPSITLPWYRVVGGGVLVVLSAYALLIIMLKVFPRGRRLDQGKKTHDTEPDKPQRSQP